MSTTIFGLSAFLLADVPAKQRQDECTALSDIASLEETSRQLFLM